MKKKYKIYNEINYDWGNDVKYLLHVGNNVSMQIWWSLSSYD